MNTNWWWLGYVQIADKKGAASVVIGRRENVSGMRRYVDETRVCACACAGLTIVLPYRTLMGSSSQSVMNNCYVPVTIVGTAISTTKPKQY
jgi:nucleotide-binding universal stress UspA family protein